MKFNVCFLQQRTFHVEVEADSYESAHSVADFLLSSNPAEYLVTDDLFVPTIEKILPSSPKYIESI